MHAILIFLAVFGSIAGVMGFVALLGLGLFKTGRWLEKNTRLKSYAGLVVQLGFQALVFSLLLTWLILASSHK
jgi:hypothetical protein